MSTDVNALFSAVASEAKQLGAFRGTIQHEPKNAPGNGLWCAIWWAGTKPARSSGLASVSAVVTFSARIYSDMLAEPQDKIDPGVMTAAHLLMGAYAGGFTFDGEVRMVDLLGSEGEPLACSPGYITIGSTMYRAAELTIPVIINDMWTEAP